MAEAHTYMVLNSSLYSLSPLLSLTNMSSLSISSFSTWFKVENYLIKIAVINACFKIKLNIGHCLFATLFGLFSFPLWT